ncbi:hypothetical protein E3V33_00215 [Candidatus Marinimicrobia bacterium MT.SAG.4]|nr:hypothetical protein E3V33_00215 [Candidatus Marinimicrobia bacterium MT.SAG.4]
MGQQQLLLIVLGTIIVGVAVVVGINMFTIGAINSERDALILDINTVAASAASYWRKPAALGGGARSFVGISDITSFGSDSSTMNGNFVMSSVTANQFVLTATGANEGVIIVATITQQGVTGSPAITLP